VRLNTSEGNTQPNRSRPAAAAQHAALPQPHRSCRRPAAAPPQLILTLTLTQGGRGLQPGECSKRHVGALWNEASVCRD